MQSYQILQVKSIISRDRYVYIHTKDLFRLKLYRKIADRIIYIPEKGIFKCNKSTTYMHQDLGTTQLKNSQHVIFKFSCKYLDNLLSR